MAFLDIKQFLPRTIYGRAIAIMLLPILTVQLAVTLVFLQRHFEGVTRQMTQNLVREITFVLDEIDRKSFDEVAEFEAQELSLTLRRWDGEPSGNARNFWDLSGVTVLETLYDNLNRVRDVDLSTRKWVVLVIESTDGTISIGFERYRVSASNPHQLLVWMVVTGLVMTGIAFIFLRNQLRPIRRLAQAAEAFGRGKTVPLVPTGAIEVRAASTAFLDMRSRIERQIEQRTLLLSGVSHDLKTPLTRMQLELELLDDPLTAPLKEDVNRMQEMVTAFLDFSRDANDEKFAEVDAVELVRNICDRAIRPVSLSVTGDPFVMAFRANSLRRAVTNLVDNAMRYATNCHVTVQFLQRSINICVEDDGRGIPQAQREAAMRPFVRLDPARNQNKASGVGLGLSIVTDVARSHGGTLVLGESTDLGGLKAELIFPRTADRK